MVRRKFFSETDPRRSWTPKNSDENTVVNDNSKVKKGDEWYDEANDRTYLWNGTDWVSQASFDSPAGTGFRHITAGVEDAASKLVDTADVNNDQITYAKMQNVSATDRFLGRKTAAAGDPEELTGTEATARLDVFTSALKGVAPASGGGTTNFLRADVTWAAPPAGGSPPTGTGFRHITAGVEDAAAKLVDTADVNANQVTNAKLAQMAANTVKANVGVLGDPEDLAIAASTVVGRGSAGDIVAAAVETSQIADNAVTYAKIQDVSATDRFLGRKTAGAGDPEELTGTEATARLDNFTSTLKGLAPLSGGGTTKFLRADGTWNVPADFVLTATVLNPTVFDFIVWEAPFACTVLNVKGHQDVSTGSTFNAFRGSLAAPTTFLAANATINATDSWVDGGTVQNASVALNDRLYFRIANVAGAPNRIGLLLKIRPV